jgi:hypothetical protein
MMQRNCSVYRILLTCSVLMLTCLTTVADDKAPSALAGVWSLQGGEMKIEFCDKETLKMYPHGTRDVLVVVCTYKTEKGKPIQAKITELDGKAKEQAQDHIPIGLAFSFSWQVQDGVATLGDVKGKDAELLKAHLEGKYEKK